MASEERSIVPMVMGIIGGVVGLPSAVCQGACAAGIQGAAGREPDGAANFMLFAGLIGAVLGLYFGLTARKNPMRACIGMIIAAVVSAIGLLMMNLMALIPVICFLVGGIVAYTDRNKPGQNQAATN